MSWHDRIDDNEMDRLPLGAYVFDSVTPDIDDEWLETASREEQIIAVREWFTSRFCNPAENTPYDGKEGGYQYLCGGPYSPDQEISDRFGRIVPADVITKVVEELEAEVGDEWALIQHPPEEEWMWDIPDVPDAGTPLARLKERLQQGTAVMTLRGDPGAQELAIQLVYVQTIASLEAFLYETALYWIEKDDERVKNCITLLPFFSEQKISLKDIFTAHDGLKTKVKEYLANLVWHRWKDVAQLYKKGIGVNLPSVSDFQDALLKRHDIVHRSGSDRNGNPVKVEFGDVVMLSAKVSEFCEKISNELYDF